YFPDDFLCGLDASHVTVPQLHGQYEGDRSRKETLVEHGFRLPSALDNLPLRFNEFIEHVNQVVFMSATPGEYELEKSKQVVEQIVRPTGLVDPEVIVKPTKGQIDDLVAEINARAEAEQRVLVTPLTKKTAKGPSMPSTSRPRCAGRYPRRTAGGRCSSSATRSTGSTRRRSARRSSTSSRWCAPVREKTTTCGSVEAGGVDAGVGPSVRRF